MTNRGSVPTSQQILDTVLDALPIRVFWKDCSLVYLGCNAAFARDAGFDDPRDVIGKDDHQMVWREQAEAYRADDRQVIESGDSKLLIDEPQTTPEGHRTLLTSKVALRGPDGQVQGVLGAYMDVTERQRAEQALRVSELLRYRRLFESAKDGILILDADSGAVVDVNPFLIELLGRSRENLLGRKVWELGFFEDILASQDSFAELQQQKYVRYEDLALQASDGRRIEVEFVSNVCLVDGANVIQCNLRDISARKRAQESQARLSTAVEQSATSTRAMWPATHR